MTQKISNFYAVIMAGGGGTRLWPYSRRNQPKQMLKVAGQRTLFQMALDRLQGLFQLDHILIVTSEQQVKEFMIQVPHLTKQNFLIEPEPRGTAAVVCLAASILHQRDNNSVMAVLTADHIIKNTKVFHQCLVGAYQLATKDFIVTLGIKPLSAHTGYGYIQSGKQLGVFEKIKYFEVKKFKEKPNQQLANSYIKNGNHLWNSGMFVWKSGVILQNFQQLMPDHFQIISSIVKEREKLFRSEKMRNKWSALRPETIDYGIMEHAKNRVVIEASGLGWSDLGSWESFFEILDLDKDGNSFSAKSVYHKKTKNTLVFQSDSDKLIVTLGLDDIIIAETKDTILVCRRENAQEIREIVNDMAAQELYNRFL